MFSPREVLSMLHLICGLSAIAAFGLTPTASMAATVVVNSTSLGNWSFDNRDGNGIVGANPTATGSFVTGPSSPPLGTGSANLATGNGTTGGDGAAELRNTGYSGVALSSITALGYSTYATQNNGQQFPYLGLTISTTGGTAADDILFFEPPYQQPSTGNPSLPNQGATALNIWQSWNALTGGWWDNNGTFNPGTGVDSLSDFLALFPNTTIVNAASGLGGVRFDVGFASPGDQFNGYIDAFTIGINGSNTTFDFEPAAATPLPAALPLFATGASVMSLFGWRRKRKKAATLATA
jgi:hypothetical protein